jgi:hypothetical protein
MGAKGEGEIFFLGTGVNSLLLKNFYGRLFSMAASHSFHSLPMIMGREIIKEGARRQNYLI